MRVRSLALLPLLVASVAMLHCAGRSVGTGTNGAQDGGLPDGGDVPASPDAVGKTRAAKVDLLLVVDNSSSMADKAKLLGKSVGPLITKIAAAGDVHIGVISSSLGSFGGDTCGDSGAFNGRAHLSSVGPGGSGVPTAAKGFLAYGPDSGDDMPTLPALIADTEKLVLGVGESGCGLEAQLESAYRFLVQPDPWQTIRLSEFNQAELQGVDVDVLAQRKAFLRPDSLVVVVLLTDEDDSSPDPLSVGGQGWAFSALQFPGSTVFRADGKTTTAPRPTSTCATNPGSADCTSCAFAATCSPSEPACQKIKADPECQKNGGYYGPNEDSLNVRYHRMKERFGIDPQYPIRRYVDGFSKQKVPDRASEHVIAQRPDGKGAEIGAYVGVPKCTNPLFATALPSSAGEELCNLPQGPRGKELVVFAVIGGVPEVLATASPDWNRILGANPEVFDFSGLDYHMIQSTVPRPGLPSPTSTRGDNGVDPTHGREWDTMGNDLQYACTFALPSPRTCTAQDPSCDCTSVANPPLCGATVGSQIRGKAYPSVRELRVVRELGDRGVVGSICPGSVAEGYASTMSTLADRLATRLE